MHVTLRKDFMGVELRNVSGDLRTSYNVREIVKEVLHGYQESSIRIRDQTKRRERNRENGGLYGHIYGPYILYGPYT